MLELRATVAHETTALAYADVASGNRDQRELLWRGGAERSAGGDRGARVQSSDGLRRHSSDRRPGSVQRRPPHRRVRRHRARTRHQGLIDLWPIHTARRRRRHRTVELSRVGRRLAVRVNYWLF